MANCFNCTAICIQCKVEQDCLLPVSGLGKAEELDKAMEELKGTRRAVEEMRHRLQGQPAAELSVDDQTLIDEVQKHEEDVSKLHKKMNAYPESFRAICCCLYPSNYMLANKIHENIQKTKSLINRYVGLKERLERILQVKEMGAEMGKLEALKNHLGNVVEEQIMESRYRKVMSDLVVEWLKRVEMLVSEVEKMKAIVDNNRSNEIAGIKTRIENMMNDGNLLISNGYLLKMKPLDKIPDIFDSLPKFLVGIEDHISSIFGYLKDDKVSVIGIHGMGGAGKTTLVKELLKRLGSPKLEVYFDLVIIVVVSQTPNIFNIQEEIGVTLGFYRSKGC